jgi:hypothetical protein
MVRKVFHSQRPHRVHERSSNRAEYGPLGRCLPLVPPQGPAYKNGQACERDADY